MLKFLGDSKEEFLCDKLPSKMRHIICDIEQYVCSTSKYNIIKVTSVFRSHDEQKEICKSLGVPYYASVHEYWRGVDIVIENAPHSYHKDISEIYSNLYPYGSGKFKTVVLHGSDKEGLGWHLHVQVKSGTV